HRKERPMSNPTIAHEIITGNTLGKHVTSAEAYLCGVRKALDDLRHVITEEPHPEESYQGVFLKALDEVRAAEQEMDEIMDRLRDVGWHRELGREGDFDRRCVAAATEEVAEHVARVSGELRDFTNKAKTG